MNAFGISTSQAKPLLDPDLVRQDRFNYARRRIPQLALANSLYVSSLGGIYSRYFFRQLTRSSYVLMSSSVHLEIVPPPFPLPIRGFPAILSAKCTACFQMSKSPRFLARSGYFSKFGMMCLTAFFVPETMKATTCFSPPRGFLKGNDNVPQPRNDRIRDKTSKSSARRLILNVGSGHFTILSSPLDLILYRRFFQMAENDPSPSTNPDSQWPNWSRWMSSGKGGMKRLKLAGTIFRSPETVTG